jgi:hypothetical protein
MSAVPEINTPLPNLDAAGEIAIRFGLVVIAAGYLLDHPAVRDACSRVRDRPEVRKALSEAAAWGCERVSESLRRGGTRPA